MHSSGRLTIRIMGLIRSLPLPFTRKDVYEKVQLTFGRINRSSLIDDS
jgi:hypothetical protein